MSGIFFPLLLCHFHHPGSHCCHARRTVVYSGYIKERKPQSSAQVLGLRRVKLHRHTGDVGALPGVSGGSPWRGSPWRGAPHRGATAHPLSPGAVQPAGADTFLVAPHLYCLLVGSVLRDGIHHLTDQLSGWEMRVMSV